MNELSKPIYDIGDTIPFTHVFGTTYPETITFILARNGLEILRLTEPDPVIERPGSGIAVVNYRAFADGRYTYRFIGEDEDVFTATEDWVYVRASALSEPTE